MKNIQDLHVVQIRIFPRNTIPYEVFSVSERQKQFKEKFHFSTAQIPFPLLAAGPKVILFESGEIELEERRIIINRLNFEDRKMVLEIVGGSADADAIFGEIASNINVLSNQNRLDEGKCIIKTQETNCAVTLDIDFWDVFSGDMKRFIQNDLSQMIALPTLSINPKKLSFEVTFKQTNEGLQEEGITISPKEITIEPRIGIPFKKRIFSTQSPFDSDTHLKMVQTFENLLVSKIKPGGAQRRRMG